MRALSIHQKECRKVLGCALYIRCALSIDKYGNLFLPDVCIFPAISVEKKIACTELQVIAENEKNVASNRNQKLNFRICMSLWQVLTPYTLDFVS
jgi:hypothetical protein